jgi:circadian clock protein KaiC
MAERIKPFNNKSRQQSTLPKSPTGIQGLDEITEGGLPRGRPTLICGTAGCGKTLMAMEFLVRGAMQFNEPGVFFTFEESPAELAQNVKSLGFDLDDLERTKKIHLEHIVVNPAEIEETGDYDLEALFIRLGYAIDSIKAKRVVLDTIETLFGGLSNQTILRSELQRLFRWLKDKGVTAVITGERGQGQLTRQGLEEYVSDCVILLDHRVEEQVSTRRLRIVKYRGTTHGSNEYPFLIDERGIDVLPVTSLKLDHEVSNDRLSTGVPRLDTMLGGGVYRGSTVLITGTSGTGKSSLSASFVRASCERGERALYFAFEESPSQIMRNMRSIGTDLAPFVKKGLLHFIAARSVLNGLETHLATFHKNIQAFDPKMVVFDPISDFGAVGNQRDVKAMLTRLVDFLKWRNTTAVLTNLQTGGSALEATEAGISSVVDTWLLLRDIELGGERNRGMYILKSRGMAHSNQIREFLLTDSGIQLLDVYSGAEGVLTGSARVSQEAREQASILKRTQEVARQRRDLDRRRKTLEAQIASLQAEFEAATEEANMVIHQEDEKQLQLDRERATMAGSRKADIDTARIKRNGPVTSRRRT